MAADDIKHDSRATREMTTRPKFERATSVFVCSAKMTMKC